MRTWVVLLCVFVMSACANVKPVDFKAYETGESITEPPIGATETITLGETLIRQGIVYSSPAIKLRGAYLTQWIRNSGHRAFPFTFESGTTLRKTGVHESVPVYSGPATGGMVGADGNQIGTPYGLAVEEDGTVRFVVVGGGAIPETPGRTVAFERTDLITETNKNFKQEFIYSGRDSESLYFTYREFSGDLARPAFTQNATYSITAGDIVAFKNLRLKIIKATNTEVTYQVLSSF
ncbi:MAG: hypothetical protein RIM72_13925 [Alphaproteobacteria bacterium]